MENAYILEMTSFSIRATRRACKKRCHFRQTQFAISNKWQQHASHIPDDVRLSDVSNARKWFISHKNCQTNQFGCWQSQPSQVIRFPTTPNIESYYYYYFRFASLLSLKAFCFQFTVISSSESFFRRRKCWKRARSGGEKKSSSSSEHCIFMRNE